MLINDGALLVKFWFHLSEQDQKARPEELSRDDHSRWKMLPKKGKFHQHYHKYERIAERVIRHTDRGIPPWYLIVVSPPTPSHLELPDVASARITLLDQLDLSKSLDRQTYKSELRALQTQLNELT